MPKFAFPAVCAMPRRSPNRWEKTMLLRLASPARPDANRAGADRQPRSRDAGHTEAGRQDAPLGLPQKGGRASPRDGSPALDRGMTGLSRVLATVPTTSIDSRDPVRAAPPPHAGDPRATARPEIACKACEIARPMSERGPRRADPTRRAPRAGIGFAPSRVTFPLATGSSRRALQPPAGPCLPSKRQRSLRRPTVLRVWP